MSNVITEKKPQNVKDFLFEIQENKNLKSSLILRERKNVLDLKIVILLDVSGSISQEEFTKFLLQIDKIRGLSVVRILEFDTKVVSMYDYFKVPQNEVMRLTGGGGTEFIPVFNEAKKLNPDAIVIMTDMCNFDGKELKDPGIPTASIITYPESEYGDKKQKLKDAIDKYPWMKNIGSIVIAAEKQNSSEEQGLLERDMQDDNKQLSELENDDDSDETEDEDEND